ncbi:MAG: thrombospondin type 3 repeat-containing protein, partial [Candidatus Melainabacteria bacterium]|nr:thrombospondin type 3 repeat-containing protein [Candidatus Melainabacteria bacterium]
MKKTIITLILISIFSYLTVVAVSALNEEDNELVTESISKLTAIQTQLGSSSSTRDISRLINSAVKKLVRAISKSGASCPPRVESSLLKLDQAASRFTSKSCTESKSRNCIQDNLINQVLPEFQGAIDDLKEVTSLDENGNGIIDVCEDDPDGDGLAGKKDNCPLVSNPEQKDVDGNRIGDACDLFFCCEDSSLTVPLEECPKKTIRSCREEGNVVVGCLAPLSRKGK